MAAESKDVKKLVITIRLGNNPGFNVLADDRATASPAGARFRCKGHGSTNLELLTSILEKVVDAYPTEETLTLCVDGPLIVKDSKCS